MTDVPVFVIDSPGGVKEWGVGRGPVRGAQRGREQEAGTPRK